MTTNERNFISAKDLPVTEAEEVDVLCIDPASGELVKKSGANLGGGSCDAVITASGGNVLADASTISLTHGTFADLKAKMNSNIVPIVCLVWDRIYGGTTYRNFSTMINLSFSKADQIVCQYFKDNSTSINKLYINNDGSVSA